MNQGKYVFSQVMESVIRHDFMACVRRYQGDRWVKNFSCWEHFLAMSFGQLSFRESLRDIVVCLTSQHDKLYHLGFRSVVARTTFADANEKRDWHIYRDYANLLIEEARRLYVDDRSFTLDLDGAVYAIDSTTIELCLGLFPKARVKNNRAAIKLHLGLDLRGNIPAFFAFSKGNEPDLKYLDQLEFEPNATYILDRGYVSFARLFRIHRSGAFFVTRLKRHMDFERIYSRHVDGQSGVRCDQTIRFTSLDGVRMYPEKLRRVKYYDEETLCTYNFLTNDFTRDAKTIAALYKYRWQIELFFKWIKQHLCIKAFWGRSNNAVKMQVCVAICAYLLVAIMKKRLKIDRSSYEILQILSVSLFDKTPMYRLISESRIHIQEQVVENQARLWGY